MQRSIGLYPPSELRFLYKVRMGLAILCTKTLQECLRLGVRWWPSGVFNAIGTEGRGFEPRPGLAVPQKLLLEWPISVLSGMT